MIFLYELKTKIVEPINKIVLIYKYQLCTVKILIIKIIKNYGTFKIR